MDNNQKNQERIVVDLFRKNYKHFPNGKLIYRESPDFILKVKHKKSIGIEITELHARDINKKSLNLHSIDIRLINEIIIQKILDAKSEKIKLYQKKKTDQLWLIIYVDALEGPGSYKLSNKISKWFISSGFDKVFLFELFSSKIWQLTG